MTAEEIVYEKGGKIQSVSKDSSVYDALVIMCEHKIGAILVEEDGKYIGIWTERDLMRNAIVPEFNPRSSTINDYMISGVKAAPHSDNPYQLVDKFLGMRIRHLLIEKNGEIIGLLSVGDVVKSRLNEKMKEVNDLKEMVNWEYYENWKWKHKK